MYSSYIFYSKCTPECFIYIFYACNRKNYNLGENAHHCELRIHASPVTACFPSLWEKLFIIQINYPLPRRVICYPFQFIPCCLHSGICDSVLRIPQSDPSILRTECYPKCPKEVSESRAGDMKEIFPFHLRHLIPCLLLAMVHACACFRRCSLQFQDHPLVILTFAKFMRFAF